MQDTLVNLSYLIAASLFIVGLKGLGRPRTAVRGNVLGALGMLIAIVVTLLDRHIIDYKLIGVGLIVGTTAGVVLAVRIQMTAMPQMVALLNGFGGAASAFVAGAALIEGLRDHADHADLGAQFTVSTAASGLVGALTLTGSLVAFGKLQGLLGDKPVLFPGRNAVSALVALSCLLLSAGVVMRPDITLFYWGLVLVASALGVLLVVAIGGADMPVVISLLNSYSGIAACATGFVLRNSVLVVAGALVGASGIILTNIMCKAMNRSLANVVFGGLGSATEASADAKDVYAGKVKSTSAEEIAMLLEGARRVVIVPGYGMAVAQAQHAVRTLAGLLEQRGTEVEYGIHPVAGRMPGHMNVLLAEANVPYNRLKDMDQINSTFEQTDVVIVIGANDVVNPLARTDPKSPIAGMPILDVDKARTVVVIKRSLSPGFAGIPNPLFALENTLLYFADGKQAINDIIASVKESLAA